MRIIILFFLSLSIVFNADAQLNMSQLGHLNYQTLHNTGCSNLWGYTDEFGNEYAIVGLNDGTSIVDITNPSNPVEKLFIPDSNSVWREVKVWQDYAYVTTEEEVGLLIIDLSPLPASTSLPTYRFYGPANNQFHSAHSLFIDENGILYLHGTDRGNGGVIFYDLAADPINPPELGEYDSFYVHDSYARGDTLYTAHIVDGFFSVINVSNKANPVVMATQITPSVFTHNAWLSTNGRYLFTTDEVSNAYVASYDITNLSNITELDRIQTNPGSGSIPHNTYYLNNDFIITSWYRDGVIIHDVQDPSNIIEVGNIDVSPLTGNGFNSIWGVYAYFQSGTIIASDMENGLYIFGANFVRGCYIHGAVTDANTSAPVNNALIEMVSQNITQTTGITGQYRTGIVTPGSYDLIFSKPGYISDTVYNIAVNTNDTTFVNVQLVPITPVTISGTITESGSGAPIANAIVEFINDDFSFSATTDGSGNFIISPAYPGIYNVTTGHWGHKNYCEDITVTSAPVNTYNTSLPKGYYDDFHFDFGWTVNPGATAGNWVRDIPLATGLPGGIPVNPWFDIVEDCGEKVYVTGNNSSSVGASDVDGGPTVLTSPVFNATIHTDPWIGFYYWFFNGGGGSPANDTMKVFINDGSSTVLIHSFHKNNSVMSQWRDTSFRISDYLTPTSTMKVIFSASDPDATGGHLLEGGVDRFYVSEGNQIGIEENNTSVDWQLFPNPAENSVTLKMNNQEFSQVTILDITGKIILTLNISQNEVQLNLEGLSSGMYFIRLSGGNASESVKKLIIRK